MFMEEDAYPKNIAEIESNPAKIMDLEERTKSSSQIWRWR